MAENYLLTLLVIINKNSSFLVLHGQALFDLSEWYIPFCRYSEVALHGSWHFLAVFIETQMYSVLYRKDIHVIRYPQLLNFNEILQLERNKLMYFLHCFFYKMSNTSIDFALKTDHRGPYIFPCTHEIMEAVLRYTI